MSEQLEELAIATSNLINASYDYREHCCEFSKFLVQGVPDDYWPDVASQLIVMLDDIDSMNKGCLKLLRPLNAELVRAVAQLNLPTPEGHLSWTIWIIDHWLHMAWRVKVGIQAYLSAVPSDPEQWFHLTSYQVRREPEKCKDISRYLFSWADRFVVFEDKERLINLVRAECLGVYTLSPKVEPVSITPTPEVERASESKATVTPEVSETIASKTVFVSEFANDRPIRWEDIEELCAGKLNRVGKLVAKNGNTVRGWQYAKGWPAPMTWQSVRKWVNERKSYDFGDPPEEC